MRTNKLSLLFLFTCFAAALSAEMGDFAPRSTMAYGRMAHVAQAARKLGGDDWIKPIERMLGTLRKRDREEMDPVVKETRRFIQHLGAYEVALCDIMVREPHVQIVQVQYLDEGAPTEFSEEFLAFMKKQLGKDAKVEATEIVVEHYTVLLRPGVIISTIGGTARNHVTDVLAGKVEESLSQVERFRKWTERARADLEVWADIKAIRAAIDRGGEDMRMDSDFQMFLDAVEWQKWETFTASLSLPSKTGGISLNADLTFSPALESVNALLRPSGACRLMRTLPAETLGFISLQLGNDADKTATDVLRYIHDVELRSRPARLKRMLGWEKNSLRHMEEQLAALEGKGGDGDKDKDGFEFAQPRGNSAPVGPRAKGVPKPEAEEEDVPMTREEQIKELKEGIRRQRDEIAEMEKELAAQSMRPFNPDREGRKDEPTDAEEMHDRINEALKAVGIDRAELTQCIGGELLAGVIALPDPEEDSLNDMFEHLWFANLELREGSEVLKQKLIDWVLGKKLPEGATEEQKAEAAKRAEQMMFKKVDGGEILSERGALSGFCVYFGDSFVGVAGSEEAARRVLLASMGSGRFSPGNVPGTAGGSKFFYADFAELFARIEHQEFRYSRRNHDFAVPFVDVRRLLKSGLRLSASTNESATRISLTAQTAGENSLGPLAERMAAELENERAWRHDSRELEDLGRAIQTWAGRDLAGGDVPKNLSEEDRVKLLKALTPEKLVEGQHFRPRDGMRSAFDPAMTARFKAMLEKGEDAMGGEGGPTDIKESGYEWFGLPEKTELGVRRHEHEGEEEMPRRVQRDYTLWMVCATKGAWVRGGRAVLVLNGEQTDVLWLTEAQFNKLRSANVSGSGLKSFEEPERELPAWKVRARLQRYRWQLYDWRGMLDGAAAMAKEQGRELEISFDGSKGDKNAQEALRKALGMDEERFSYMEYSNVEIEAKGGTFRVRVKMGAHWVEMNEKGTMKTSLGDE